MRRIIFALMSIIITLSACKKYENGTITGIHPVKLAIITSYASADLGKVLPKAKIELNITNIKTKLTNKYLTDANGLFTLDSISPGVYDISAKITIAPALYSSLTGETVDKDVVFNAAQRAKTITIEDNQTLELKLISGTTGPWVIKQIYYAGSNVTNGASFRDQFIEIYNNSDSVLYADSLYIAEAIGIQNYTSTNIYRQPNGQYDWSKSLGMPSNVDANNDYVYTRALFMIPGKGKEYPVQPGTSIVLAQTAINHKSPFTGTDGKTISVRDPSLTVDLSGADFETYYGGFLARPLASDVDNPLVPNVDVLSYNGTDFILEQQGRMGYIIFKNKGIVDVKDLPKYPFPNVSPSATAAGYYQIPLSYVIDGVETQSATSSARVPKKLVTSLDALYTSVPNGSSSSQSVIRKTERTVNGRIILKDTNNSAEDFDYLPMANPRGFK